MSSPLIIMRSLHCSCIIYGTRCWQTVHFHIYTVTLPAEIPNVSVVVFTVRQWWECTIFSTCFTLSLFYIDTGHLLCGSYSSSSPLLLNLWCHPNTPWTRTSFVCHTLCETSAAFLSLIFPTTGHSLMLSCCTRRSISLLWNLPHTVFFSGTCNLTIQLTACRGHAWQAAAHLPQCHCIHLSPGKSWSCHIILRFWSRVHIYFWFEWKICHPTKEQAKMILWLGTVKGSELIPSYGTFSASTSHLHITF